MGHPVHILARNVQKFPHAVCAVAVAIVVIGAADLLSVRRQGGEGGGGRHRVHLDVLARRNQVGLIKLIWILQFQGHHGKFIKMMTQKF